MQKLFTLVIAVLTVVLSACATTGTKIPKVGTMLQEATGQNGRACVRQYDIDGYGVLDGGVVSIDADREYYLATLWPGCHDIAFSMRVLFNGRFTEICGGGMNKIHTRGESCNIKQLFEFENREQAFETYNAVKEKREQLKAQAAVEGE